TCPHRRRAGMIGRPDERDHEPALSNDRIDDRERQIAIVQHRSLLDVKLQIADGVACLGVAEARRGEPEVANRIAHRTAAGVTAAKQFVINGTHERAAADEWPPEADALLV